MSFLNPYWDQIFIGRDFFSMTFPRIFMYHFYRFCDEIFHLINQNYCNSNEVQYTSMYTYGIP